MRYLQSEEELFEILEIPYLKPDERDFNICEITKKNIEYYNKMSGYGFGIWLVPKDRNIQKLILHTPHITVMCNMESEEYAKKLFNKIKTEMGDEFTLKLNGKCHIFQGGYQSSDPLLACGYFCESEIGLNLKLYVMIFMEIFR